MSLRRAVLPLGVLLALLFLLVTVGQGAAVVQGWTELAEATAVDLTRPGWTMLDMEAVI